MGVGRPRVLLELNPAAGTIISAEIGVDFISVVRANFAAEILWRTQESTRPDMGQQAIIDRLLALLAQAIRSGSGLGSALLGIAIGVPGLVDQTDGTLLFAPNLGWRDVPLCALLRPHLEGPVFVDNEANLAALGEYYFGAARGFDEILYISAGVGLGGGIVRAGHLFKGATGFAGEFGHMTMDPHGQRCNCGNRGCWETQVSQSALFRYVREGLERGRPSVLPDLLGGDLDRLTVAAVVDAAGAGDEVALAALDRVGHYLGIGIASLVNALNPGLVVFGGILSLAGDYLLPAVQEELQERALRWNEQANRVVLARYSFDACVMGGIAAVYHAIITQPGNLARQGGRVPAFQQALLA
jgi:glucokinase-like ROK family protein